MVRNEGARTFMTAGYNQRPRFEQRNNSISVPPNYYSPMFRTQANWKEIEPTKCEPFSFTKRNNSVTNRKNPYL